MPDEAVTFVDFEPDEAVLAESGETLFGVGDVGLIPAETTSVVFAVSVKYGFHDNHLFILIIPHVSSDKWRADAEKREEVGAELGRLSLALTPPLRHAFAWGRGGTRRRTNGDPRPQCYGGCLSAPSEQLRRRYRGGGGATRAFRGRDKQLVGRIEARETTASATSSN